MVATRKSRTKRKTRRSKNFNIAVLGKPAGVIQPRVQQVGPERFGIVAVDCAKVRSKWMLADFFGNVLVEPVEVEHHNAGFRQAIVTLKKAVQKCRLEDVIVGVEMTGIYHKPVFRAFRDGGFETRLVHPFASSHYRLAEHGDIKTDDNDLVAIFRAVVNGFGLLEKYVEPIYVQLQILARHRRDLVKKKSKLQCQIRHHVHRCLPGFADLFKGDDLWTQRAPVPLLRAIAAGGGTPQVVRDAGVSGMTKWLEDVGVRVHKKTLERIVVWAAKATKPDENAASYSRVWSSLLDDWSTKRLQIQGLQRDLAALLVKTPYVLLLSHPGINVVSAAELAGEMGSIENYASAKAINGRAGLFPSRYQSDEVDRGGNLTRFRNAKLRAAWMLIADNMVKCNAYWMAKAAAWKQRGVKPCDVRARIANRLTRTVFTMISGRQVYHHPSRLDRGYVIDKLLTFHREHKTEPAVIVRDLKHAADMVPTSAHADEATPIKEVRRKSLRSRKRGPQQLGELLVGLLARLGVMADDEPCDDIEST